MIQHFRPLSCLSAPNPPPRPAATHPPTRPSAANERPASQSGQRLAPIEGLRGYLALWVLVGHVLWSAGCQPDAWSLFPRLLAKGRYAVEVFMIISGFVIFLLLDRQRENYWQFLVRRFFRIYPVFILLFLLAIPGSLLLHWNTTHTPFLTDAHAREMLLLIQSWWANIAWHVPVHLLMLHGAVPPVLLDHSSMAFLAPAWSLSTEWQFYLVAPLAFALATTSRPRFRVVLCAACVCIFAFTRLAARAFPVSDSNAALPYLIEFFFLGAVSYFLFKRNSEKPFHDSAFPIAVSLGVFLFILAGASRLQLAPVVIWIVFLGLLLEHPASWSSRFFSPIFTHRLPQYLGRISYSLYLSHVLLMFIAQYLILKFAPGLARAAHILVLLATTVLMSIAVSAFLYRWVESPANYFGKRLARKLARESAAPPSHQRPPRRLGQSIQPSLHHG